jgi:hypothetical protein
MKLIIPKISVRIEGLADASPNFCLLFGGFVPQ